MSINVKKYTKDQMVKMVEDAQAEVTALEAEIIELKNSIDEQKKQLIEYADFRAEVYRKNSYLKNDNEVLRGKLKDTETALARSANEASRLVGDLQDARMQVLDLGTEVDVARNHPWRNLWAWVKRKLVRHE
nr:MAG TPA: Cell cycle protein [Caudoviricetes sp.]